MSPTGGQERPPTAGGRTPSLGQPRDWHFTAGLASRALNRAGGVADATQIRLATYRAIGNPVVQGITVHLEGYSGARKDRLDVGARARLMLPALRLGVGFDHNQTLQRTDLTYSFVHPGRRGGLFRDGTQLRVDWTPSRHGSVTLGIETPIFRDVPTGRTRPARDHVQLVGRGQVSPPPVDLPVEAASALAEAADAARNIRLLAVPFLGRETSEGGQLAPLPRSLAPLQATLASYAGTDTSTITVDSESRRFHDAIARAFSAVLDSGGMAQPSRGRRTATAARGLLLDEVLLPYNRLLGQRRSPDTIRRFGFRAQGAFLRWLHAEGGAQDNEALAALQVFTRLLEAVERERAALARTWGESRFVWLPLQYAVLPEEHDTQAEVDALVSRAVESPFTEGNFVSYVINEQFQAQLSRTIREAEDYHVLVTHDFRGIDDGVDPDVVAFRQTLVYLETMAARVRAYDRTGRFPTYLILHDQWYYSLRQAPLFLRLLEDPMAHRVHLPRAFRSWEDSLAVAQRRLRDAVEASSLLQRQRALYGEAWLRDLVKVHVNVTNRPDPTFWSWSLIPGLPVGDAMLRDHRKLVFYDISEDDPYRGQAIYTGAGVGEHYTSNAWEDRSLLVTGPALLHLKGEVRALLLAHGLRAERIPYVLQPREKAPDYDTKVQAAIAREGWPLRALGVHNRSGYLQKNVNVAKAVLYTMMPAGSVIVVPDSFWNSEFWGAALFGASLRGVRVLMIAPSNRSNSVEVAGTQLLIRELLARLMTARTAFAGQIAATGGMLQIGVFDSDIPVPDIPGKVEAVRRTLAETPWLREVFGFPPHVYDELAELRDYISNVRIDVRDNPTIEAGTRTKIHLKANLFASREAWSLMTMPSWGEMTWSFVTQRLAQVQRVRQGVAAGSTDVEAAFLDVGSGEVASWYQSLDTATRERVIFYTIMGSQNQNGRSMIMDAEDALVVARWPAVIPYLDAIALIAQSRWITAQSELDALLPPLGPVKTRITHWARLAY